jgi:hypothetical protein
MSKEIERAELHKTIWRIANDLRGSADQFDALVNDLSIGLPAELRRAVSNMSTIATASGVHWECISRRRHSDIGHSDNDDSPGRVSFFGQFRPFEEEGRCRRKTTGLVRALFRARSARIDRRLTRRAACGWRLRFSRMSLPGA